MSAVQAPRCSSPASTSATRASMSACPLLGVYPNYREVEAVKTFRRAFHQPTGLERAAQGDCAAAASRQTSCSARRIPTRWENLSTWAAWRTRWWAPTTTRATRNRARLTSPSRPCRTIYNKGNKLNSIIFTTRGTDQRGEQRGFRARLPARDCCQPPFCPRRRRRHLAVETALPATCRHRTPWASCASPSGSSASLRC